MNSYSAMAGSYNDLMRDIDYEALLRYYEQLFSLYGKAPRAVLDAGCGTGTLSYLLADRGYDVVAVDPSAEMLTEALMRRGERPMDNPLFLNQSFLTLDLYGTVEAAVSSLDCVNYITDPAELVPSLKRVRLFLEPGGVFVFDVISPVKYEKYNDSLFTDRTDDIYCVWQVDYNGETRLCSYGVDIFRRQGELWELSEEEHTQRCYTVPELESALLAAGFTDIRFFGRFTGEAPREDEGRIFVCARRPEEENA